MAVIETWIKTDLKKVVRVNPIGGNLFSQDNMGNLIGVELLENGQPATVSGSVSANVLRADGATVAVSGTLSGNRASVTLPQAAYAVPGMLAVVIKLTTGSVVTTIGAIQAIVYRSSSDTIVDPGTIIPSVQDLIAAIDAAVDSIPPDYSDLVGEVDELKSAIDALPWKEIYDKTQLTNGYINTQGGIVTQNAQGWHISDYMPITADSIAKYSGLTTVGVSPSSAYYDSNKDFISPTFKQAIGTNTLSSIPTNAAFVRFSINDADVDTFSFIVKLLPGFDDLDDLKDDVFDTIPVTYTLNSSSNKWTKKAGYIGTQNGWSENSNYDSYYFTAENDSYIYCTNIPAAQYVQLCIYPSGEFGDSRYVRYRASDNNLPSSINKLRVTDGTMIIVSVTANSTTFEFKYEYNSQEVKGINNTKYAVGYDDGVLSISGRGLECYFSDATFELASGGLFELQALTINGCSIFGTENDYIGPVKVRNESIVGAKHGGETTDSIKIYADGTEVVDGTEMYADSISIYITSHIDTRFSRVSTYTISFGKMSASSLIVQNTNLNIENIFGAGIISSYDASTLAWINDYLLTSADTTGNLGEQTIIVTNKGNVISRRTQNKSAYTNSPVYFLIYSGRKKLYYYNTYRLQDTDLPAGSVYSSAADLLW